jgi:hypothetical protein
LIETAKGTLTVGPVPLQEIDQGDNRVGVGKSLEREFSFPGDDPDIMVDCEEADVISVTKERKRDSTVLHIFFNADHPIQTVPFTVRASSPTLKVEGAGTITVSAEEVVESPKPTRKRAQPTMPELPPVPAPMPPKPLDLPPPPPVQLPSLGAAERAPNKVAPSTTFGSALPKVMASPSLPAPPPTMKPNKVAPSTTSRLPLMKARATVQEGFGDEKVELGVIRGVACEPSEAKVMIPFPIQERLGMTAMVSSESGCLSVQDVRGAGTYAEITLGIHAGHSLQEPFVLTLGGQNCKREGEGTVVVGRPAPYILGITTVCGGQNSEDVPVKGEINGRKKYRVLFEPKLKEFWVSQAKGVIDAGARKFPFKVFFAPRDPRPISTLMIVDMGDEEICVQVCGSIGGFEGRRWGERRH